MQKPKRNAKLEALVEAIEASVAVVHCTDARTHWVLTANSHFRKMLGLEDHWRDHEVFPISEALPRYARAPVKKKIVDCLALRRPLEFEQAIDHKTGTSWWRVSVKPFQFDEYADCVLLTCLEITERVELENRLQRANSRFRSVIDAAYDAIITVNASQEIILCNEAALELFGYTADELVGKRLETLMPTRFRRDHGHHVRRFGASPLRSREMEERNRIHAVDSTGAEFPVEIAISKIKVDGLLEYTAIVRDITERVRLMDELATAAATDPLTGLKNRRDFEQEARGVLTRARELGRPVALAMLEIDHFKLVNDTHGHDVGDEVLGVLARVGSSTLRHRDIFARLGGEEFVVLMPDTNIEQGHELAVRLCRLFDEADFEYTWSDQAVHFTISVGVAELSEHDDTVDSLLKRADQALYRAKNGGRNRVERG